MAQRYYVITGGTLVHVAPHFALAAPAYGAVGMDLARRLKEVLKGDSLVTLVRTRMSLGGQDPAPDQRALLDAAGIQHLETNEDLDHLIKHLVSLEDTRCIVMAAAVCDFEPAGLIDETGETLALSGKRGARLRSGAGSRLLRIKPSQKIIGQIRAERKDIFVVGFKATAGESEVGCYARGLDLLKGAGINLVLANDVRHHLNMIVTPEEFRYVSKKRKHAIRMLAEMISERTNLSFVRTKMRVDEPRANLLELEKSKAIPENFVPVLRHLIARGAYKPFRGRTSGHFGCKVLDPSLDYVRVASVRKENHNDALENGVARIYKHGDHGIEAGGAKPSVGEHTQHHLYQTLGDQVHSIVHFHSPLSEKGMGYVANAEQKPFECGSVECGDNTARNIRKVAPGLYAVHLDGHGPNIAFHRDTPAETIIEFIEQNFNLEEKTGGLLPVEFTLPKHAE